MHHNLAVVLARKGRYAEARFHFEQALGIDPDLQIARQGLASLPAADDDISRLLKGIENDPASPEPYFRLGNLFKRQGALQKALVEYQRALERQSDYTPALKQLGIVHAMRGDYRKAVNYLFESVSLEPGDADAYHLLAGIYARQKMTEDALYWLKKVARRGQLDRERILADPNLDAIRDTESFRDFVRQM